MLHFGRSTSMNTGVLMLRQLTKRRKRRRKTKTATLKMRKMEKVEKAFERKVIIRRTVLMRTEGK